jgi:DNA mismatch endonuclease (patch repair protein)
VFLNKRESGSAKPTGKNVGVAALWLRVSARKIRKAPPFSVKPNFVFPKLKLAVFVDGCFWHGCPIHATWPKQNGAFWRAKILGNKTRDRRVDRTLRKAGWRVLRVWEHELVRRNEARLLRRLAGVLG